jgi:CarD family transcriptional regulator
MATKENIFARGSWIVHSSYGVGKVKKLEEKEINGKKKEFYRIEADETTYWVPVEKASESPIRPVASRAYLSKMLNLLKKESKEMDSNFKIRQNRIKEVLTTCNLRQMVRLLRDLWVRSKDNKLSDTELNALHRIMNNLVVELSVVEGVSEQKASLKLREKLGMVAPEPSKESSSGVLWQFVNKAS